METLYDMMPYQSTDLYPQQVLPVNTASTENYTLPTPPHSPPQITDLSGSLMGGHNSRHFTLDPPQTFPTDLSLSDNLDTYLPDIFSCPFTSPSAYSVLPDPEEFGQVPSPTPSPEYYSDYQHVNFPPTNYVSQGRSFAGSVGDDSDQEGNFSDDTMHGSSQPSSHSSRRHEDLFTPASLFHGGATGDPQRTHNYQRKTDPITMSELVGGFVANNGSRMKQKPQKRRPTTSSDSATKGIKKSSRGKGRREAMKGNHLWEFIRDLLKNKSTCPRIIRWENRQEGVFRFVNSEAVAGLWGTKKNNPNMNYEKLSRAMRYYYKREILERVDGRRLVYKFGCNADGWREAAAEATQDD